MTTTYGDTDVSTEGTMKDEDGGTIFHFNRLLPTLDNDKAAIEFLEPLYTQPFKYKYRSIMVGGRITKMNSFHYDARNSSAPSNKFKKEYIDDTELVVLYRYALKAAIATKLQNPITKTLEQRLLLAMCEMSYDGNEYICLAILTTMCVTGRNDFLVLEKGKSIPELWMGTDRIKLFTFHPEKPVNHDILFAQRFRHFDRLRWFYMKDRCIPIDTQELGDVSKERETEVLLKYNY